ncbi:MAG: carbohydrate binding domain-containing protein [Bacteroidales bacterium]|nr:carbohydrate binding domain-containing protein [Bacteroidales bacterium]
MKRLIVTLFLLSAALGGLILHAQKPLRNEEILKKIEASGSFAPLFPFQPTHSAPDNITNVRTWTGVDGREAGADGFVSARGDRFVDGAGREIRFIGTNLGMTGCFPKHEDADRLAKELTRYGINLVRMHYVSHRTPEGGYPVKDSFIEPVQLERFDYLFSKLKENGIYIYFQLNIARKVSRANGFENAHLLPYYKNGIDNINPRMIELQKRFHKEILEHVNPYTGIAYKDDPAISMMELANENSIVYAWFSAKHKFPNIVEPYKTEVREEWNRWLYAKYGSTEALRKAWLEGTEGDGSQLLPEGIMNTFDQAPWQIQANANAVANKEFVRAKGKDRLQGSWYMHLTVTKTTPDKSMPKLYWAGIPLKKGAPYCLKMKMRSSKPMAVSVRFGQAGGSYKAAGLAGTARTGGEWKEFTFNFTSIIDEENARFALSSFEPGTVDVADVQLISGLSYKWPESQSLENLSVEWPYAWNYYELYQRAKDFTEFLYDTEYAYFKDLRENVKNNIGAPQPLTSTQLNYGFNQPAALMDYCDMHGYWCHPAFYGKWDWYHWYLRNSPLVSPQNAYTYSHPATVLTNMAHSRILGRPFTVSEYDHPNLNFYSAEGNILLSAIGAFQNWSALMQFAWILDTDYDRDYVNPMFDMCSAPQKLVHFPACWAMFVRKDVHKGSESMVFASPSNREADVEAVTLAKAATGHESLPSELMKALPLVYLSGRQVEESPQLFREKGRALIIREEKDVPASVKQAFEDKRLKSGTGELSFDWTDPRAGVFMVDSRNTKVFTGFVRGRSFEYKGLSLKPGKTRLDWLTLSLTLAHPAGEAASREMLRPGRYLLAATGLVQNTGQKIVPLDMPERISSSQEDGGSFGKSPVLCEGIPATLTLKGQAGKVKCFALDPDGKVTMSVPVKDASSGDAILEIGPQYSTVWYEIVIEG